jgi:hypothetical protein
MIATLLVTTALVLGNDVSEAEEADAVLASYDLTGVLATHDDQQAQESLLLSAGSPRVDIHRTAVDQLYGRPDADAIVEILARLFQEEFEYEGRELALQGDDELLVLAPEEVQARVRTALDELERTLASAVELQIDVLSLPADAPAPFGGRCVVDESQVADLSAAGRAHERYHVRLQAGRTSIVDRMRRLPLLSEYDVEIAQGAMIHDPVVGNAEAGTRILLRGAPVTGGTALSVSFAHGEPGQEEPTPIEAPLRSLISTEKDAGERFLEAPRLQERYEIAFRSAAFDTVLPDGRALVLGSGHQLVTAAAEAAGERNREIVVIRRVGGEIPRLRRLAPPVGRRELLIVNAESLSPPTSHVMGELTDGSDSPTGYLRVEFRSRPSVFLVDWIDARFATWRLVGPWLVCVSDPTWDGDAVVKLEALLASRRDATRLLEIEATANVRGEAVASWRLPVRAGSDLAAVIGVSTTSLEDYNVEVAQFAATADPEMRQRFFGLAVKARATGLAAGGAALDVDAALNHRRALPHFVALGGPMITKIERTSTDRLRVVERIVVAPDTAVTGLVLGERGGSASVAVSVR